MPKREVDPSSEDGYQVYLKRQKIKHVSIGSIAEEIHSARQLQHLLSFEQDAAKASHGIQSFKAFLESLGEEDKADRIAVLKEFLQSQVPQEEEEDAVDYLPDLMQTWKFASQTNYDSLLSAVSAVLALLFRTISGKYDFVNYGLRLGRTLLHKQQLELFARCLTANKTKEHVISPSLRLLREVSTFDGGALTKNVFRERDSTFKALVRNLSLRYSGEETEDPRRPSVRTHSLRLFLTYLKFLSTDAKKELLEQRDIISAVTRDIKDDPPFLIYEFLEGARVNILQDESLAREIKSKFVNFTNLSRIVQLYGYNQENEETHQGGETIEMLTHDFLILACTSTSIGLLHRQNGFYPRGFKPDDVFSQADQNFIDLGLDSLEEGAEKFVDSVPVHNTTLSEFIRLLRPWANTKQSELLISILTAAPELIADYFYSKRSFSFDPKLTPTWIGYSAFLYSALQLPIPPYFGNHDRYGHMPPPTSVVIENILPQPLSQKVMAKCLNQNDDIIAFFGIRILIVAFQKLQKALEKYCEAASEVSPIWKQAAQQLIDEFCQRCPPMKEAVTAFRNASTQSVMQKQAASQLLALYYEIIPQVALESKFNVSDPLSEILKSFDPQELSEEDLALRVMDIKNLFSIAQYSPGTRWFNKTSVLPYSPFVAMIALFVQVSSNFPTSDIRHIAQSVVQESGILLPSNSSIPALIAALKATGSHEELESVYEFLDNCALRCATASVKYIDTLEAHAETVYGVESVQSQKVSLLLLAFAEQWPFVVNSAKKEGIKQLGNFIANYAAASVQVGEDKKIIKHIINTLTGGDIPKSTKKAFEKFTKLVGTVDITLQDQDTKSTKTVEVATQTEKDEFSTISSDILSSSQIPPEDPTALTRWATKDLDTILDSDTRLASSLITLLSSPERSIRLEALTNTNKLAHMLSTSAHPAKDQLWLLLSELVESARVQTMQTSPLPGPLSAFAIHAIPVLLDPLHPLYPKIAAFLTRAPSWEATSIPMLHAILSTPPSVEAGSAYYTELSWLLSYLPTCLRSMGDMAIFHKRKVFEVLLGLYNHPWVSRSLREKIVAVLVRATGVREGDDGTGSGSLTLVTRFSILSWIEAQVAVLGRGEKGRLERVRLLVLRKRIVETCDERRLEKWSGRSVEELRDVEL